MFLSRRQLLSAFLGAPFAYAACRNGETRPLPIQGEIVGQSAMLGHVLREKRNFQVPNDKWESRSVVIVGAGIAGLSAGWGVKKKKKTELFIFSFEKKTRGDPPR